MNIGILSYSALYTTKSLRSRKRLPNEKLLMDAAKRKGHTVKLFRSDLCELFYDGGKFQVLYAGKKFPKVDVLIPRANILKNVDLELSLNKHLLLMGMKVVNGYMPVLRAKNKIRMLQALAHGGVPIPRTVVLKRLEFIDAAIKRVGGFPVIIKTPTGSLGKGVAIVESRRSLLSSLDIIWMTEENRNLLVQEYVAEAEGRDIRAFVVGGRVVASMERQSAEGDFRSNIGAGGQGRAIELTPQEVQMSLQAAEALKLDIAGVDILRTKKGPVVMEINANPGLEGITGATGIDVPGAVIDFCTSDFLGSDLST